MPKPGVASCMNLTTNTEHTKYGNIGVFSFVSTMKLGEFVDGKKLSERQALREIIWVIYKSQGRLQQA